MENKSRILLILIIAIICVYTAGIFIYIHDNQKMNEKNPIYLSLGFALSGTGGSILTGLIFNYLLPGDIKSELSNVMKK
jgi:hypothetical protein